MAYLFNMVHPREIDKSAIRRLIIVDTKQAHRIGELADVIGNPGLEIHIFDHHPATQKDIRADPGSLQSHRRQCDPFNRNHPGKRHFRQRGRSHHHVPGHL
ncbi:MAG: hypothetical protein R2860_09995 [Desulfobacterales bacterium]